MIPAAALPDFVVIEYADVLWAGFLMTIKISAIGIVGSLFVGLVGAAIGELRIPVLRQAVRVYVEAIPQYTAAGPGLYVVLRPAPTGHHA